VAGGEEGWWMIGLWLDGEVLRTIALRSIGGGRACEVFCNWKVGACTIGLRGNTSKTTLPTYLIECITGWR